MSLTAVVSTIYEYIHAFKYIKSFYNINFMYIISFIPYNCPINEVLLSFFSFYRYGKWGIEKLSNLSKVTEPFNNRARNYSQVLEHQAPEHSLFSLWPFQCWLSVTSWRTATFTFIQYCISVFSFEFCFVCYFDPLLIRFSFGSRFPRMSIYFLVFLYISLLGQL